MLVLGIETATWTGSVGLVRDGAALGRETWHTDRSHTGILPGRVTALLARCGVSLEELDGLAVSIGPGSFTGLRVGVAFAKGLAFAGALPVAEVSTLEALAHAAGAAGGERVCAAVDARKREVYAAFFTLDDVAVPRRESPDAVWQPAALGRACTGATVVVGDAAAAYPEAFAHARVRQPETHPPRGDAVAWLGWQRLRAGDATPLAALAPRYVRAPDAKLPAVPLARG